MALIAGTPNPDTLSGTAGVDVISGLGGADFIRGREDDDTLFGGAGGDTIAGDNVPIPGGPYEPGRGFGPLPTLDGVGVATRNLIFGEEGDDSVAAGFGSDVVFGGPGRDTIFGYGFSGLSPSAEDFFNRLDRPDLLFGEEGDDLIRGGGGSDVIHGGEGRDTLAGGYDPDILTGGAGADRFVIRRAGIAGQSFDSGVGENNRDIITDFRPGEDLLDLSGLRSIFLPADTPPPVFVGTAPFGTDPVRDGYRMQVRTEVEEGRTIVQVYTAFNAPPPEAHVPPPAPTVTVEIELLGVRHLSAADLVLG